MRKFASNEYFVFTQNVIKEQKTEEIFQTSYEIGTYAYQPVKEKFYRNDVAGNRWYFEDPKAVPADFKALLLIEGILNA